MPAARPHRSWLVAALLATLAIQLYVLYSPGSPDPPPLPFPGFDKLVHIGIFALPALTARLLTHRWWPIVAMAVHVPLSEVIQQSLIPYRGGDWLDAVADLAGVGLGVLAAMFWTRRAA